MHACMHGIGRKEGCYVCLSLMHGRVGARAGVFQVHLCGLKACGQSKSPNLKPETQNPKP